MARIILYVRKQILLQLYSCIFLCLCIYMPLQHMYSQHIMKVVSVINQSSCIGETRLQTSNTQGVHLLIL